MKKLLSLIALLALCQIGRCYNQTYAVIVGVADYKHDSQVSDLTFTTTDARAMYKFLLSPEGGSVPKANMCLLLDNAASREGIVRKAEQLFAKAQKNDRVIFFFSGHGSYGYFLPHDYDGRYESALTYNDIKSIFRKAKCNTKLLFADACLSGGIKPPGNMSAEDLRTNSIPSNMNIAVMTACADDEVSYEADDLKMGIFTHFLIKGLGGAANRDGNAYITIQELYYYVYKRVVSRTQPPRYSTVQTPQLFGKFDLRLIVANTKKK